MTNLQMLNLNDLATGGNPGITAEKGSALAQAAAVCLEEQGHNQGTLFTIRGNVSNRTCPLAWPPANSQGRRTWNDAQEATAEGASGIAALLANREIGHQVILRSRKSTPQDPTGFDYWLGDYDIINMSDVERRITDNLAIFLEDDGIAVRARAEVSGIRNGYDYTVNRRVDEKLEQMGRSDHLGIPAYAIVVEFGRPLAVVSEK